MLMNQKFTESSQLKDKFTPNFETNHLPNTMNVLVTILAFLFIANPSPASDDNPVSVTRTDNRVEIVIEGNDQMKFNLSEIRVKEGDTVTLTLKHVGQLPATAMGHNWVLLKQGVVIKDFAMAALQARDNDYIPADTEDVIAHTKIIGGGEETTIEFTAPAAGTYDFICSFPGHYALMQGKFIVE